MQIVGAGPNPARARSRDRNGSDQTGKWWSTKRAAVGGGPYGVVRGVSMVDGRAAETAAPTGCVIGTVPIKRTRLRHASPSYGGAKSLYRAIFSGGMYVGKNSFCFAECAGLRPVRGAKQQKLPP